LKTIEQTWECKVGRCPSVGRLFYSEDSMAKHYEVWHPNLVSELVRESKVKISDAKQEAKK
jgi:hypothetical protein